MVGRQRELAEVTLMLDRVAAAVGTQLLVIGPAGSGRTAVLDAAAVLARARGIDVLRVAGIDAGAAELDRAARALDTGAPHLVLVDDLDRAGTAAVELLGGGLGPGAVAVLASARSSLRGWPELHLGGLAEPELAELLPSLPSPSVHAIWLASAGLPGVAIGLAGALAGLGAGQDAVLTLALTAPSRAEFLDLDPGLVRLLEEGAIHPGPPGVRARVLARLARELLGDASSGARRRELVDEAVGLARSTSEPAVIAEVLDSALHAIWDPAAAQERLTVASEIVTHARAAGAAALELRGLFWRFIALVELGRIEEAEAALARYGRAGEQAGDAEAAVVVLARQAMLATIRGRFDDAAAMTDAVAVRGRRAGLADSDRLVDALRGGLAFLRGGPESLVDTLHLLARRLPGHFFEATAARNLVAAGRLTEAGVELDRLLPALLAGSGPRWLGAVADLATVAATVGEPAAVAALYGALLPYRGRLVVWGGANTVTGPVDAYLGRLATRAGRVEEALSHLDDAIRLDERTGLLPDLALSLLARAAALSTRDGEGDRARAAQDRQRGASVAERLGLRAGPIEPDAAAGQWRLDRDGEDWLLQAGSESARIRDSRGMRYLRALLAAPGQEIAALDLAAGGAGLRAGGTDPTLDEAAILAYRRRLAALDQQLEDADRAGDADWSSAVVAERAALVAQLRRASGLGGRVRRASAEDERARVNVTRALWAVVERLEMAAPLAGAHLRASLRTGHACRYQPASGGPARWRV
jgi:tetratricopeptide (TPR) repeat protein